MMIRRIDRFHMVTPATHNLFPLQELAPARSSTDQWISIIAMVGNYLDAGVWGSGSSGWRWRRVLLHYCVLVAQTQLRKISSPPPTWPHLEGEYSDLRATAGSWADSPRSVHV